MGANKVPEPVECLGSKGCMDANQKRSIVMLIRVRRFFKLC